MGKTLSTLWLFLRFELKQLPYDLGLVLALFRQRVAVEIIVERPQSPLELFLVRDYPRSYGTLLGGEGETQCRA